MLLLYTYSLVRKKRDIWITQEAENFGTISNITVQCQERSHGGPLHLHTGFSVEMAQKNLLRLLEDEEDYFSEHGGLYIIEEEAPWAWVARRKIWEILREKEGMWREMGTKARKMSKQSDLWKQGAIQGFLTPD